MKRNAPKKLLVRFAASMMILILIFSTMFCVVVAEDQNPNLDARRIADINKPGTVMIQTYYFAKITVPEAEMNPQAVEELNQYIANQVYAGKLENTQEAMLEAWLKELLKNPMKYMVPSKQTITKEVQTGGMGPGCIVTRCPHAGRYAEVTSCRGGASGTDKAGCGRFFKGHEGNKLSAQ